MILDRWPNRGQIGLPALDLSPHRRGHDLIRDEQPEPRGLLRVVPAHEGHERHGQHRGAGRAPVLDHLGAVGEEWPVTVGTLTSRHTSRDRRLLDGQPVPQEVGGGSGAGHQDDGNEDGSAGILVPAG